MSRRPQAAEFRSCLYYFKKIFGVAFNIYPPPGAERGCLAGDLPPPAEREGRETSANKGEDAGTRSERALLARHNPTGSLRHPQPPGRTHNRAGLPPNTCSTPGGVQKGVPGTPSCSLCSCGHLPGGEGLGAGLQKEMEPPRMSAKGPPSVPGVGSGASSKAWPPPVRGTCWEHWAGPRDGGVRAVVGLRLQREGMGEKEWGKRDGKRDEEWDGKKGMGKRMG